MNWHYDLVRGSPKEVSQARPLSGYDCDARTAAQPLRNALLLQPIVSAIIARVRLNRSQHTLALRLSSEKPGALRGPLTAQGRHRCNLTLRCGHPQATLVARNGGFMVLLPGTTVVHDSCRMLLQPSNIQFDKGRMYTGPRGQSGMHEWNATCERYTSGIHACANPSAPLGARQEQAIGAVGYSTPDLPVPSCFPFSSKPPST